MAPSPSSNGDQSFKRYRILAWSASRPFILSENTRYKAPVDKRTMPAAELNLAPGLLGYGALLRRGPR